MQRNLISIFFFFSFVAQALELDEGYGYIENKNGIVWRVTIDEKNTMFAVHDNKKVKVLRYIPLSTRKSAQFLDKQYLLHITHVPSLGILGAENLLVTLENSLEDIKE